MKRFPSKLTFSLRLGIFVPGILLFWGLAVCPFGLEAKGLPIGSIERDTSVDFGREILPLLKKNCTACHNQTKAKGDVILETFASIAAGADGEPILEPGNPLNSALFRSAAHLERPVMPPKRNKVGANPLSPEELGLLRLWIEEGASPGEVSAAGGVTEEWFSLQDGPQSVYAVALTEDAQLVACGRANRITVHAVYADGLDATLVDSSLEDRFGSGVAHADHVQALAFHPDGDLLASGGYRTVKLWRRESPQAQVLSRVAPERPSGKSTGDSAGRSKIAVLAASGDESRLAAGTEKGTLYFWDLGWGAEGAELNVVPTGVGLRAHAAPITAIGFGTDGRWAASGARDGSVVLSDTSSPGQRIRVETPSAVRAMALLERDPSEPGDLLVVGGADGVLRIWRVTPGELEPAGEVSGHTEGVRALFALPSAGAECWSVGDDGAVRHWALEDSRLLREIEAASKGEVVAFAAAGRRLAIGGEAHGWTLRDLDSSVVTKRSAQDFREARRSARLSRRLDVASARVVKAEQDLEKAQKAVDRNRKDIEERREGIAKKKETHAEKAEVAEASAKKLAEVTKRFQELESVAGAARAKLEVVRPSSVQAAEGEADKVVAADEPASANEATPLLESALEESIAALVAEVEAAEAAASEAKAVVAQAQVADDQARQRKQSAQDDIAATEAAQQRSEADVPRLQERLEEAEARPSEARRSVDILSRQQEARKRVASEQDTPLRTLVASAGGGYIAGVSESGRVHLWSAGGEPLDAWTDGAGPVAFVGEGRIAWSGNDGRLFVQRLGSTWRLERTLGALDDPETFPDRVSALSFDPEGRRLVTASGEPSRSGKLRAWNVEDWSVAWDEAEAHTDSIYALEFTWDGNFLASCGADKVVNVWNAEEGTRARTFEGHTSYVLGVSWRFDGQWLASCGADNAIKLWDFEAGRQLRSFGDFKKQTTAVRFLGTTSHLICTAANGILRTYDGGNGKALEDYKGVDEFPYAVDVTPDGRVVASGGYDSVLRVWSVESGKLLRSFDENLTRAY